MTSTFDLHGLRIRVAFPDGRLANIVQSLLCPFATVSRASDFALSIHDLRGALPPAPPELPITWEAVLPGGLPILCRRGPRRQQIEIGGAVRADLHLEDSRADIHVLPGGDDCLLECVVLALIHILGHAGRHVVHAASLFLPVGAKRRAVLISGPSGAGKTTAALALAREGLCLMTDDATFVQRSAEDGLPRLWGLPTPIKVHSATLGLLPWLKELRVGGGRLPGECSLAPSAVSAHVGEANAEPGLVLLLGPRNARGHVLAPVDKMLAVERLVRENVRSPDPEAQSDAGRAFGTLVELVRHSRTYSLSLSPRIESLYGLIRPLLEQPAC